MNVESFRIAALREPCLNRNRLQLSRPACLLHLPDAAAAAAAAALDTLLITDVFAQNQNERDSYERTRCSHDQCTVIGIDVSIDNFFATFRQAQRPRGLINGIEIMEILEESRNAESVVLGAELNNVSFASAWNEPLADDSRFAQFSYSGVAGQASGYAPKIAAQYTAAQYNGAWTNAYNHQIDYGAASLLYSITDTGSYIHAFFFSGTDIASEDELARFVNVNVNALGKFELLEAGGDFIKGSFFGDAADEAAGILEYDGDGGERVLGAFGVQFEKYRER